jgi:DNA-binding LacI/PurR family transcriptional regulator
MADLRRWIGLITPTSNNSFSSSLASSVDKVLRVKGFETYVADSANNVSNEIVSIRQLESLGANGIISVSGLAELPEDLVSEDTPIVWVDRRPESKREIPWVGNDDASAMELAVEHLIERGCRTILLLPGYVAQDKDNPRVEGYRRALEKNGIPFRAEYVLNRPGRKSSEEEAGELITKAVRDGIIMDGIITSSDRAAFGAGRALQRIGYFVPEDVRLVSFDNSPYAAFASPSLTTLDRRPEELAKRASEVLCACMEKETDIRQTNIIDVSLIRRGSSR